MTDANTNGIGRLEAELRAGPTIDGAVGDLLETFVRHAAERGIADVVFATTPSPVGEITIAATVEGVVAVGWDTDRLLAKLAVALSPRVLEDRSRLDDARRQMAEYFDGTRLSFDLPIDWSLTTGFRRGVLQELATVPFGTIVTYKDLAERVHSPKAARAVGSAMAANPLPLVVPCHRVLQSGGALGNYGGGDGPPTKAWLLRHEGVDLSGRGSTSF
ncbi:MAG: methylated-DNA--[protein]-cysteine S-methyltransferase [Actinobacteria bacterium]|nr:methylated-DNA--[protein]-cysteine S-methyltransferase [Actinomycetota bacterium]